MAGLGAWLEQFGLSKYADAFAEAAIDLDVLPDLSEADLADLGVKLGDRKRLLKAIAARGAGEEAEATPRPAASTAERRQLTVLFCDLVGSTELSRKLDPEDMSVVMRAYHGRATEVIQRWGGHVAKYLGDGVLAYFGWPQAHEDDPERAVRAGLALTETIGEADDGSGKKLAVRVGIATGPVVVGELIGEGAAQEQAVVGETPNLAARLQTLAGPGAVVISATTRRLVGGLFELTDLGPQRLKGFGEPLSTWRVDREAAAGSRFEATRGRQLTSLVGREHELGLLLDRWSRARDGEGQVVLLAGEAGIGKSRIVGALRERLADHAYMPLSHYCSPYHANTPLHPVIGLLERAAGFEREDQPAVRLAKLEDLLTLGSERLDEVVPLVAALLGLPAGEKYPPLNLTPQRQKQRTLEVLVDQVAGLATRQPVLAIYEDVHWIDPTSLEALGRLIDHVQGLPVLVLITYRPDFSPPWRSQAHIMQLSLTRLSRNHGAAMVQRMTDGKTLPAEVLDQILARTDGVPLFVEELTKTVLEAGLMRDAGGRYELIGPLPPLAIPSSLRDSLTARLDRLAPVKEVAQTAAVIGRDFSHELLVAVADKPEADVASALGRLLEGELIFRRGSSPAASYSFKHALVQDVAYQSLLKGRRQKLHERIARALLRQSPDAETNIPEVVAHHLTEAALPDLAVGYWLKAGERAIARFALAEAIADLTRGLELIKSLPDNPDVAASELTLLIALGPPLTITKGQYAPEVERLYARADDLVRQIGDETQRFAVLWGLWNLAQGRADWTSALSLVNQLMIVAEGKGDRDQLLQAHHAAWATRFHRGELMLALPHLAAGRALYDVQAHSLHAFLYGGHDPGNCCQLIGALTLALQGHPERATAEDEAALSFARKLDNPPNLAHAQVFGAHLQQFLRDGGGLLRRAEAGIALASEQGMTPFAKLAEMFRGWALLECDAVEEGAAQLRRVLARARERKKPAVMLSYYLSLLADACGRTGNADEALAVIADAFDMIELTAERVWEAELHRLQGEFLLTQPGGHGPAEQSFGRALDTARRQSARLLELRAATSLARLWAGQGERRKAHDLLAPVYGWFTEGFDTRDLKEAKALLEELA